VTESAHFDPIFKVLRFNFKEGEEKPIIAYGNGSCPSGGRGEVSMPTKYMKKKCKQFYKTKEVNEYQTSIICPCCNELLMKVKIIVKNMKAEKEIRGLRRCGSNGCAQRPFLKIAILLEHVILCVV